MFPGIYLAVGSTAMVSLILIITSSLDLVYLNRDLSHTLVQIQIFRIAVEVVRLSNSFVFIYAMKNVKSRLLLSSVVVYYFTGSSRMFLVTQSVLTRMPQDGEQSPIATLEHYPIIIGFLTFMTTSTGLARWHFCLQLCWKHHICGIRLKERIGGVRIRSLLLIPLIFTIMAPIFTVWNRAQLYFNVDIRTKFSTDYWYALSTCAFLIIAAGMPIKLSYDLILGLAMKCEKRLQHFYRTMFVFVPLYGSMKRVTFFQEKDILHRGKNHLILIYLTYSVSNMLYIGSCIVLVFLYRKYLKHYRRHPAAGIIGNEGEGNKFNSFRLSKRKLLNIRTINVGRIIDTQLGSGCWSTVYLGKLSLCKFVAKSLQPVAIKVISGSSDPNMTTAIYEELKNTSRVLKHQNLVHFIGTCFLKRDKIKKPLSAVNIVMEYCEKGSLELFLPNLKHCFVFDTEQQLWRWSLEIAGGMEYLAEQKLVHGDLSTRNILLDEKLVAKISDFGMSRKLYEYQQYARIEQSKFPWKWMSPESLDQLKFTLKSDIYSYGILLWEIYSLGQSPWIELCWTSNFVARLRAGERLEKPMLATEFVYNEVMLQCWKFEPNERPTFSQIRTLLQKDGKSGGENCL